MYRVWYWAMIDRESDGRFIASIPDLGDLAAHGDTDKDAVAQSIQGRRPRHYSGGSWTPGSVANSALSLVRLSSSARRRVTNRATPERYHPLPPRATGTPRRFNSSVMSFSLTKPAAWISRIVDRKVWARTSAARFVANPPGYPSLGSLV